MGTACGVAWLSTAAVIPLLRLTGTVDVPNSRSSHAIPTPRGGGVGLLIGLAAGLAVANALDYPLPSYHLFIAVALMALVGIADDKLGGVSILIRLSVQILAALIVTLPNGGLLAFPLPPPFDFQLGVFGVPVAIIWIVGVTNIYNFLDGIDGFAASQAVIVGVALGMFSGNTAVSVCSLVTAAATLGFLAHNWRPARVFMGDVGAPTLGMLFASLCLQFDGTLRATSVFATAICLWFFLTDATFTLLRRFWRRERFWAPHRTHLYQRLVQTGLRHDQVVLPVMAIALVLSVLAVLVQRMAVPSEQWTLLATAVGAFVGYDLWAKHREAHLKDSQAGQVPRTNTTNQGQTGSRVGTTG